MSDTDLQSLSFLRRGFRSIARALFPVAPILCVGILTASNGISLWRLQILRVQEAGHPAGISPDGFRSVVDSNLRPLLGNGQEKKTAILFLFRLQDCPAPIEEVTYLNSLQKERPEIAITAIIANGSDAEAQQTRENFRLGFPVLADPDGSLLKRLHPPLTPWKAIFALPSYHLVMEDGPSITPTQQQAFYERARDLRLP